MKIENIELYDMAAWNAFVESNRDAILERYGSIETALQYARNGGLELGGVTSPLFIITLEF